MSRRFIAASGAAGRIFLVTLLCCLLFQAGSTSVWAVDRQELASVIRSIPPNGPPDSYGDLTLRPSRGKGRMPPAVFPHWLHRAKYTCRVCHLELKFSLYSGETRLSRGKILGGKYCGACHNGREAFSAKNVEPKNCDRCHLKDRSELGEKFGEFSEELPDAQFGNGIDWAEALEEGDIQPQISIHSSARAPMRLPKKLEKPLQLGTGAARSDVWFSHVDHMVELDCSNCHPDLFNIQRKGTESFSMDKNIYGFFCGRCHRQVAFPMNDCHRCHPQMSNKSRY